VGVRGMRVLGREESSLLFFRKLEVEWE